MKNITFISDTHSKHHRIPEEHLPGGDILIHSGDVSTRGYMEEIRDFLEWFSKLDQYTHKIFIAGNHDFFFEDNPLQSKELVGQYPNITYLQDNHVDIDDIRIYGSPWQPEFYDWAFNLPRNGDELKAKWSNIPTSTDILVTHGPPFGILDVAPRGNINVGCEVLTGELKRINPIIHVFGHIHYSYGYIQRDSTHYINAACLGEDYVYKNLPLNIRLDKSTRDIIFR